jgi:hypothetical protein
MKEQLEKRLLELKNEYENGQKIYTDLSIRQANLRESLLRISGAIHVLEEELKNHGDNNSESIQEPDGKLEENVESKEEDNKKECLVSS